MSSESEEPRKAGPPPPSIASKPATPPAPSIPAAPATPPPSAAPAVKVKVKEGSDEDELETPREDDGSAIPVGTRVIAYLIDMGIAIGLGFGVVIIAGFLGSFVGGLLSKLAYPLVLGFILTRDGLPFLNGQSPGKTAMKIKAVTVDGKSLAGNWQPALVRNVVLLIPFFPIVELVVLLTREDKPDQGIRLGDEWAKTRVVRAAPPVALEEESA